MLEGGSAAANWNFSLPSNTKDWLPSIFPQLLFIVYTRNCQPWFYALLCWMMGRRKGLPKEKDSKSRENELDTSSYSKSISALLLSSCKVLHAALNDDTLALGENTKKHSCTTQNISDSWRIKYGAFILYNLSLPLLNINIYCIKMYRHKYKFSRGFFSHCEVFSVTIIQCNGWSKDEVAVLIVWKMSNKIISVQMIF